MGAAALLAALVAGCPERLVMRPPPAPAVTGVPDLSPAPDCGSYDAAAVMACVSAERYEADARAIARARAPGSEHHRAIRDMCATQLTELGYETRVVDYGTGANVIGDKPGFSKPDEIIVVGAHYDQKGDCPGADDNASGVAAVLEAARVLAAGRFDRTLVLACWDEGERGQLGSAAHAERAQQDGAKIQLAVSFEAIAFASEEKASQTVPAGFERLFPDQVLALIDSDFRANFLTVVAESATEPWAKRVVTHGQSESLAVHVLTLTERMKVKQKELHRSDHASFWDRRFPAMLVTDSGPFRNPRVGCRNGRDEASTLDFHFATRATRAAIGAIVDALEPR